MKVFFPSKRNHFRKNPGFDSRGKKTSTVCKDPFFVFTDGAHDLEVIRHISPGQQFVPDSAPGQ
jgi:hypothetical protein